MKRVHGRGQMAILPVSTISLGSTSHVKLPSSRGTELGPILDLIQTTGPKEFARKPPCNVHVRAFAF